MVFRQGSLHAGQPSEAGTSPFPNYQHHDLDIRDRAAVENLFQKARPGRRPHHPHRRATLARLGRARTAHGFRRQRRRHAEPAGGHARSIAPRPCSSSPAPTRSMATRRTGCRCVELEKRWEIDPGHPYTSGIDETMSIDQTKHSLFGASKVAADVLVQEYGTLFRHEDGVFSRRLPHRPGARRHGAARLSRLPDEMHGRPARPYRVFGYKGKQVRDNIHSHDLVEAFWQFFQSAALRRGLQHRRQPPFQLLHARSHRRCANESAARS